MVVGQTHGVHAHAVADQPRGDLQLPFCLRVLRISSAVQTDRGEDDPVLQVEAEEFAASQITAYSWRGCSPNSRS